MNWTQWLSETKILELSNEDLADRIADNELTPDNIREQMTYKDAMQAAKWLNGYWNPKFKAPVKPKEIIKIDLKLVIADGSEAKEYVNFLNERFNVTVVNSGEECDLVLFTGGEDVNPVYYYQNVGSRTYCNENRDKIERETYRRYKNIPKLGICRGAQFLTVMSNGKLIQHTTGHTSSHAITVEGYGTMETTSSHHQMVYPFDLPEDKYQILAYSKQFRSDTYLDGDNNEIELPRDFVEVEIVKYGKDIIAIQGHPEYSNATDKFKTYCLNLIVDLVNNKDNVYKSNYKTTDEYEDNYEPAKYNWNNIRSTKSSGKLVINPDGQHITTYYNSPPTMDSVTKGNDYELSSNSSRVIKSTPINWQKQALEDLKKITENNLLYNNTVINEDELPI